jgi:hypothetical protein
MRVTTVLGRVAGVIRMGHSRDDAEELYGDPLAVWREWTVDVRGRGTDSDHHMAEDARVNSAWIHCRNRC